MDKHERILRLKREYKDLMTEPLENGISKPSEDINFWSGELYGPLGSYYEGGIFKFSIVFPEGYPFKPPFVRFNTKIHHPNIDEEGNICLNILTPKDWLPTYTIKKIIISICSLLVNPNPYDPLDQMMAYYYLNNKKMYQQIIKHDIIEQNF